MPKQYQIFTQWSVAKADNYDELYPQVTTPTYVDPNILQQNVLGMYKLTADSYRIFEVLNSNNELQLVSTDYVYPTYEEAATFINDTLLKQDA